METKPVFFSETKDEDQTMIAYRESDVLENIEEEDLGIPLPPKVTQSLSYVYFMKLYACKCYRNLDTTGP